MQKTFNEWKESGFIVIKGERARHKDEAGKSYFDETQVKEIKPPQNTRRSFSFNLLDEDDFFNNTIYPTDGSNDDIGDFGDW